MEPIVSAPVTHISDITGRMEAAFNARDAVALAALYSDTALLMPPSEPMVSGQAGIQAWFERAFRQLGSVSIVPLESTRLGDQAYQVGTFTSTARAPSTQDDPSIRAGKYVLLMKRQAGQWKIDCDIWNLDQPIG